MNRLYLTVLATGAIVGSVIIGGTLVTAESGDDGVSHHKNHHHRAGEKLEVTSEVLGVATDELKTLLESQSFEEVLASFGYESKESFFEATVPVIEERLGNLGLSEDEIAEKIEHIRNKADIMADFAQAHMNVLGITRDDIKALKDEGKSFSEILSDNGYESIDAFHEAVANELSNIWEAEGVDSETIAERLERFDDRFDKRQEYREKLEEKAEELGIDIDALKEAFKDFKPGASKPHRF